MRHFVGIEHQSVRRIVNALNQNVSLPWEPTQRYGGFSCDRTMFIGMVSGFLDTSVDLEMMGDTELNTVIEYIFDSEEKLSEYRSREAIQALSEPGVRFLRSAETCFQYCFLEYPPDKRVWFTDTALGLSTMIANHLFPAKAAEGVR